MFRIQIGDEARDCSFQPTILFDTFPCWWLNVTEHKKIASYIMDTVATNQAPFDKGDDSVIHNKMSVAP